MHLGGLQELTFALQTLLAPVAPWEGGDLPIAASFRGELNVPARELRDPYVFRDDGGALYLYYVGGGEQAIGVVGLIKEESP